MSPLSSEIEDTESLKEAVLREVQPAAPSPPPQVRADPRDQDEWTFQFSWTDPRGKVWSGTFTNSILTMGEQQAVAALIARCTANAPWDAIIPDVQFTLRAVAHMSFSLKSDAPWAKDLRKLKDPALVLALWGKVASHETRYFRLPTAEEDGESAVRKGVGTSGVVDQKVPTPGE